MKKLLGVITAAAVLLGSTIAYASAGEPTDESAAEEYSETSEAVVESDAEVNEDTNEADDEPDSETNDDTSEVAETPATEMHADSEAVEDQAALLEYIDLEDGSLEVRCPSANRDKITDIVIPSQIDGKIVAKISESAFWDCINLQSITIPTSVTEIGDYAFRDCTGLFSVTIPEGIKKIPSGMFLRCVNLQTVILPNSITEIGDSAFKGCINLISIAIPEGVTKIEKDTFRSCSSLTTVFLPKTVTDLGDYHYYTTDIFKDCPALKEINVSEENTLYFSKDGVLYAHVGNSNRIFLMWYPQGKEDTSFTLQQDTFVDDSLGKCYNLEAIYVEGISTHFDSSSHMSIDGVLYDLIYDSNSGGKLGTYIEIYPAGKKDTHYTIPNGIKKMGNALENKTYLVSVTMPEGITEARFAGCNNLETINIPLGVKQVDFSGCTSLKSIILPEGVTNANFRGCTSLETVNVPSSITSISFYGCEKLSSDIILPSGITKVQPEMFYNCKKLKHVELSDSVTEIGKKAFYDCSSLTAVRMSENIESIGDEAFYWCWRLQALTIPQSVKEIGEYAFEYCSSFTSVNIPKNVTEITYGTFKDCHDLTSVNIPQSVKSIKASAFEFCGNLKSIRLPGDIENIEKRTFWDCNSLTNVRVPDKVKSIGYYAFADCDNLQYVTIPLSTTEIVSYAFYGCKNLTDVYYAGTEEQWADIGFGAGNEPLKNATIHYKSTGSEIVDFPIEIEIPKPSENAPETKNMQVSIKQDDKTIDTIPINDDGTLELSGIPDGEYNFTFSADNCAPRDYTVSVSSGTVTGLEDGVELRLYGDIDDAGDGIVDIRDVAKANKHFKTGEGLSDYLLIVADVNGDGVIDIKDVALMNAHFKQAGNLWE